MRTKAIGIIFGLSLIGCGDLAETPNSNEITARELRINATAAEESPAIISGTPAELCAPENQATLAGIQACLLAIMDDPGHAGFETTVLEVQPLGKAHVSNPVAYALRSKESAYLTGDPCNTEAAEQSSTPAVGDANCVDRFEGMQCSVGIDVFLFDKNSVPDATLKNGGRFSANAYNTQSCSEVRVTIHMPLSKLKFW